MHTASMNTLITALISLAGALISVVLSKRTVAKDRGEAGIWVVLPTGHHQLRNRAGGMAMPTERRASGWLGS